MTLSEFVTVVRERLDDIALPQKWSDSELVSYIDTVYGDFCSLVPIIMDNTTVSHASSAVCNVTLSSGVSKYTISNRIVRIAKATIKSGTNMKVLGLYKTSEMDEMDSDWEVLTSGPVSNVLTDYEPNTVYLVPAPDSACLSQYGSTLTLRVQRKHLTAFTLSTLGSSTNLEIPDDILKECLVEGVMAIAYRKDDAETYNMERSTSCQSFYLANVEEYKREYLRRQARQRATCVPAGLL